MLQDTVPAKNPFCIPIAAALFVSYSWLIEPAAFQPRSVSFVCNPFIVSSFNNNVCLVFQIRMQAQGNMIQGSMMGNFINIYQEEGTRGLWKVQTAWICLYMYC